MVPGVGEGRREQTVSPPGQAEHAARGTLPSPLGSQPAIESHASLRISLS